MKSLKSVFSILIVMVCGFTSHAETLDLETTNDVVVRMEKVLASLEKDSDSYLPMQLRLADLYADRARLYEVKDATADAATLKKAEGDRKKAIAIYEKALPQLKGDDQSRVLAQTAHLYQLTGNKAKAQELYAQILKNTKKYSNDLLVQSYLGVAEMALSQAKYDVAEKNFKMALALRPSTAYIIQSRLAWTYYHNQKEQLAVQTLEGVLKEIPASESTFREEVARDYASFLAHIPITTAKIDFLAKNTPEIGRHDNLVFLAGELDRLGKKTEALYVWKYLGEQAKKSDSDYEEHLRLAQIQYDLGHKIESAKEIELFVHTLKTQTCDVKKENCDLMRLKFRKLLTDWAKAESRETSLALIHAYGSYLSIYSDLDMSYWAAESAENIKSYREAIGYYRLSADIAAVQISKEASHHDSHIEKTFEGSCMGEIDVAERLGDLRAKKLAYDHYIQVNPKGDNILSVRYQRAYADYDEKKFDEAAVKLHAIALEPNKNVKDARFRDKAADTSIEALIALKDQSRLIFWSQEYSKAFPDRNKEFASISRNAILTQESTKINDAKSQDDVKASLAHLDQIDLKNLSKDDKLRILKSKLAAAEKIKDLDSVQRIAKQILEISKLSAENIELATSRLEWVSEMRFQFDSAFKYAQKMKTKDLSPADRAMKLAVLAELAGHNPNSFYQDFLAKSQDQAAKDQVMAKLVRSAHNHKKEFAKYRLQLQHNAELSAQLGLEIFADDQDYTFAKTLVRKPSVAKTAEGATLQRFIFIKDFKEHKSLLARTKLDASSPQKLKASLRLRMAMIKQGQKEFDHTVKMADWTLELLTLNTILVQEKNLASDIQNLPVPKGVKGKDRLQYKKLLADQAIPYQQKVNELDVEISKLWAQGDLDHLYQEVRQTNEPIRSILIKEIKYAIEYAPDSQKQSAAREVAKLQSDLSKRPSSQVLKSTQAEAQARPFDVSKLLQLKEVEKKANNQTYVAYLDRRLSDAKESRQ